jgi:AcrR family transcriptional regulator
MPTQAAERRLTAKGARRREAIVAAAAQALAERGYDGVSMSAIARRAGIAKSVIYDHFPSKARMYEAIVESRTRALVEHVRAALPPPGTEGRLRAGVDAYFEFLQDDPVAWRMLARDAPADPELLEVSRRLEAERSRALAGLMDKPRGAVHRRRKELFVALLATTIRGLSAWWHEHPDVPREEVVDAVMAIARSGIDRPGGPPGKS